MSLVFFFFNDTATTEIYTLSLHDALPISLFISSHSFRPTRGGASPTRAARATASSDRKSTRLNSSHSQISYAVFCLKKNSTHCQNNESRFTVHIVCLQHQNSDYVIVRTHS